MAKLFTITLATKATKHVHVVAETAEEAQAKLALTEGEVVEQVEEKGEVTL